MSGQGVIARYRNLLDIPAGECLFLNCSGGEISKGKFEFGIHAYTITPPTNIVKYFFPVC